MSQSTPQIFRLMTEFIFMLVGALLIWVALTGHYLFDPRRPSWLVMAAVVILWGFRAWRQSRHALQSKLRMASRMGAVSLVLVGAIFLSLAWMPFAWVGLALALAGAVFVLRGLAVATILAIS